LKKAKYIWMDDKLVKWEEAKVHVLTHTLHYGFGVFEGIRFYKQETGGSAIFRLREHIERLLNSAKIIGLPTDLTEEHIINAIIETIKANGLEEGYIRPIIFLGDGAMGLNFTDNPVRFSVAVWEWGAYLGDEGLKNGIKAKISSFVRHHVNASMTKAKVCGNYVNSILAKKEAVKNGYDEAIILDTDGYVSEASGENIFIVKNGVIKTPPLTSILPGITRDSVMEISRDCGIPVVEQRFTRDELYIADEVFLTGTAAEITPVRSVDDRIIGRGKPGEITRKLQEIFFNVVRGKDERYKKWLWIIR
jgi:branched-chain amino acid aminotransferase